MNEESKDIYAEIRRIGRWTYDVEIKTRGSISQYYCGSRIGRKRAERMARRAMKKHIRRIEMLAERWQVQLP